MTWLIFLFKGKGSYPEREEGLHPRLSTWPGTHDFPLVEGPAAVGSGQCGRTFLQVPRLVAVLSGAADRDSVDAVGVTVTRAVVPLSPAVPGCPDENGAQALPTLEEKEGERASAWQPEPRGGEGVSHVAWNPSF